MTPAKLHRANQVFSHTRIYAQTRKLSFLPKERLAIHSIEETVRCSSVTSCLGLSTASGRMFSQMFRISYNIILSPKCYSQIANYWCYINCINKFRSIYLEEALVKLQVQRLWSHQWALEQPEAVTGSCRENLRYFLQYRASYGSLRCITDNTHGCTHSLYMAYSQVTGAVYMIHSYWAANCS